MRLLSLLAVLLVALPATADTVIVRQWELRGGRWVLVRSWLEVTPPAGVVQAPAPPPKVYQPMPERMPAPAPVYYQPGYYQLGNTTGSYQSSDPACQTGA